MTNESSDSSSDGDHDGMYYLCRVGENELGRVSTDPITVSVVLDGQSTEMEIDTGASVSVMSESRFKKLWPEEKRPVLMDTNATLRTYTEQVLGILGEVKVSGVVQGIPAEEKLPLVIVAGRGPDLTRTRLVGTHPVKLAGNQLRQHA